MVGVAGKSQACNTCRLKRLKCDMTRPFCLKCIKSKRQCTGYGRDLIFVNRTPSCPSTTAMSVLSELRAQEGPKSASPNPKAEATLHQLFSESSHNCREFRMYAVELLEAMYLPKQSVSSEGSFSWVYHVTDLNEPSKSLDTALFAFCLAQLHVTGTGGPSLYQCLDQYNTALQHLYSDLADSERRFREETLAAIVVLSTCELFVCPAENGWSVHARGIAEILRLRDPGMKSTPAWRHLFSRMRIVCTLEALTKRQAQILENDIWRQIVTESGLAVALDEVYRMIADFPGILERAVALPSISDQSVLLKESAAVTQSILAMVESVESWHDGFWKASPTPRSWSVPSRAVNPADADPSNKIFPFCFEFESLSVAVPVVMCWSVSTQLYSTVIQIHSLVQARLGRQIDLKDLLSQAGATVIDAASPSESPNRITLLPNTGTGRSIQDIQSEGTRMARYVCQSMEYFHRIEMGTYGGHATTYPSWSARQYFRLHPGHEREWLWIQNMHMMEGPNTRWGLSMMTFADIAEPLGGWSR
ncbi:uncharacterized protein F4817DRAFT_349552 [Daldinia loculata]|uniref:uncharacterized protein n=1 Tax=Daldinia loculata TaxID=103429 RepID=UPI0020C2C1B0|nr:uncharacterized protein F4817DRAFT_349552 [Daldinia loculata]KAI1643514.1 hypothetical protein F4817DRAFT_349552 [Daldinia loculata]